MAIPFNELPTVFYSLIPKPLRIDNQFTRSFAQSCQGTTSVAQQALKKMNAGF
jgi:hypothetical protein